MASATADSSSAAAAPSTAPSPPASPWSNRNVRGALAFSVCYALGSCLWAGDAQVAYLFLRTGRDNVAVGYFEGCSGLAQTAAAVPVALLIDRYRRDTSLRAAGVIGAAAVALTAWAVAFNSGAGASLVHLWAPLVLWGVFDAVSGAAVESIFADSIAEGARSRVFAVKYAASLVAGSCGPLLSIALFYWLGDTWSVPVLRIVLLAGVGILVVPVLIALFAFSDDASLPPTEHEEDDAARKSADSLGEESGNASTSRANDTITAAAVAAAITVASPHASPRIGARSSPSARRLIAASSSTASSSSPRRQQPRRADEATPMLVGASRNGSRYTSVDDGATLSTTINADADADDADAVEAREVLKAKRERWIPIWLGVVDILVALGAGMTIKYFPLYFLDVLGLSPIHVAALFFVSPLVTAAFTFGVTALARRIGRAEAALLSYALGTGCLFAVAALPPSVALLPLFVVRSALMNCTTPIARSILMDCVAREDRGKWNALESIMSASWSGSAVLGGFLSDWRGYRFCFLVTACVYAAACGVFAVALVPLVPREVPEDFGEEDDE